MNGNYKLLTMNAVRQAAETLMAAHGTTTTLEVKNLLRNAGYWALQVDVSFLMDALAGVAGWTYVPNGRYRVYAMRGRPVLMQEADWFRMFLN